MAALNFGRRLARRAGSGIARVGSSRGGVAAIALGAAALGFGNTVAPAARDAALEVAFDDPNADQAFLGRKMSGRFLAGTLMGGNIGGLMRASAPSDYLYENPMIPTGPINAGGSFTAGGIGAGIGTLVGGAAGGFMGGGRGAAIGAGIGAFLGGTAGMGSIRGAAATTAAGTVGGTVAGGIAGFSSGGSARGKIGKALGFGILGGIGGGMAGGAVGGTMLAGSYAPSVVGAINYVNDNQEFFQNSPYAGRTSSNIANSLNASGDIVLGMHNSRRGY